MIVAIVLGVVQGVTEWLPVSSEGAIVATYTIVWNQPFSDAVATALWLHLGTMLAAVVAFRGEILRVVRRCLAKTPNTWNIRWRVILPLAVSGFIGLPLLMAIGEISTESGAIVMGAVGLAMLVTGTSQIRRPTVAGGRVARELTARDGLTLGLAQGLAVVPGLSRSGLTVAVLLARNFDRREALVISFLMGIPASLGAAMYIALSDGFAIDGPALVSVGIAAVVGFATIHGLLAVIQRINFGMAVVAMGGLILFGSVVQVIV